MSRAMLVLLLLTIFTVPVQAQSAANNAPLAKSSIQNNDPAPVEEQSYIIGPEDVLIISVWKEPELTQTVSVRPDGKISLPLLNDLPASGITALQLKARISNGLKRFITDPVVTVIVQSARSHKASVVGEVMRPGTYYINSRTTLVEMISLAGGFRDYAATDKIWVMRTDNGKAKKIPFNYRDFVKGKHLEQNIVVKSGDIIVVP